MHFNMESHKEPTLSGHSRDGIFGTSAGASFFSFFVAICCHLYTILLTAELSENPVIAAKIWKQISYLDSLTASTCHFQY